LTKQAQGVSEVTELASEHLPSGTISITGKLNYADARTGSTGKIKVVDDRGHQYDVVVPEGLGDIVRSLWEDFVVVTGTRSGKKIILEDITKASASRLAPK
jgi:hypothetical protein